MLKQREKSSNCERNQVKSLKEHHFDNKVDESMQLLNQSNLKTNVSKDCGIPRNTSKTKYNKSNNTSKHASKNRIKMDFSIVQSEQQGEKLNIENFEEIKNQNLVKNKSYKLIENVKSSREKTEIPGKEDDNHNKNDESEIIIVNNDPSPSGRRKYSQANLRSNYNQKILDNIKKLSLEKYGDEKTTRLLLLINHLANPKEILSKDRVLKDIFHEEYIEAKEYFSQVFD